MGILERIGIGRRRPLDRSAGGYVLFPPDNPYKTNWWQLGQAAPSNVEALSSSAVYAAVSVISQEIARLPVKHYRKLSEGGRVEVQDSRVARILRRPNPTQTRSDFFLNFVMGLLLEGNAYAVADRDAVGRILAIHGKNPTGVAPQVDPETGAVFYRVGDETYPARDVLHARLFCPSDPLVGVSPITACGMSMAHGQSISRNSLAFWQNQSRPAGVLSTDRPLSVEAARRLRDQWESASSGDRMGKTAVLDSGLNWQPLGISPQDAQIVEQFNLQVDDIARVFRVPLSYLARLEGATWSNVESQRRAFYSSCLAFYIEHIEGSLNRFFLLPADQEIEFDVERAMQRSEFDRRMTAAANAIRGGIYSPNEIRDMEGLPPVEGGDEVFLQAQMEPVEQRAAAPEPPPPPPAPVPPPAPAEPDAETAERLAKLEGQLALQRMEFAHELGSLKTDLDRARESAK